MTGTDPAPLPAAVREDRVVPAGQSWSARLVAGELLRIIDLEGRQAVDFLCYDAGDPVDRYSAANTIKLNARVYLGAGSVLWSMRANPLMSIVEDTCGLHDTLYGCCSIEVDRVRYGREKTTSCQSNFERELARHGLGARDLTPNVNFFMHVPVATDGSVAIAEGRSRPGDHVDLRAERDLLVVLSNCPERDNPAAGFEPTPIRVIVYAAPDEGEA